MKKEERQFNSINFYPNFCVQLKYIDKDMQCIDLITCTRHAPLLCVETQRLFITFSQDKLDTSDSDFIKPLECETT